jgi:uncharacterized membrane protein HdeD (DUF308 family)
MKNKTKWISKQTVIRSIAIVGVLILAALFISGSISPAFAVNKTGVNEAMKYVIDILVTAAKYVGAVIALWGIFQIILALRREDSEGVSKQIITVVVGGALTGLGFVIPKVYNALAK